MIEKIKQLYYDEEKTLQEVMDILGISRYNLLSIMNENGLQRRSSKEVTELASARRLEANGMEYEIDKETLLYLYKELELSFDEVAARLNTTRNVVQQHLKKYGIPSNKRGSRIKLSDEKLNELAEFYKAGNSLKATQDKFGLSAMTVRSKLKEMGVRTRSRSEAKKVQWQKFRGEEVKQEFIEITEDTSSDITSQVVELRTIHDLMIDEISIRLNISKLDVYGILTNEGIL